MPEIAYGDSQRLMKTLIRELQFHDDWVSSFRVDADTPTKRRRTRN